MRLLLAVILALIGAPLSADALSIVVSVPSLTGHYDGERVDTASIDLGVRFTSIERITLSVAATGLPGEIVYCANQTACTSEILPAELLYLVNTPSIGFDFGTLGPFGDIVSTDVDVLSRLEQLEPDILSGRFDLQLSVNGVLFAGVGPDRVVDAAVDVAEVVVTVDGLPVPEASTIVLVALGLGAWIWLKPQIRRQEAKL